MAMGIDEPQRFDYLSPPTPQALASALQTLLALGCIAVLPDGEDTGSRQPPPTTNGTSTSTSTSSSTSGGARPVRRPRPVVTAHGRRVATLPLDPMYAHFVLKAGEMGCVSEALTAVAMLSAENVLYTPSPHGAADAAARRAKAIAAHRALSDYEGDVPTLINVYERWRRASPAKNTRARRGWCWDNFVNARSVEKAHEVRMQLAGLVQRLGLDPLASCGNGACVSACVRACVRACVHAWLAGWPGRGVDG
jgi:HrpA-like RNA helicase